MAKLGKTGSGGFVGRLAALRHAQDPKAKGKGNAAGAKGEAHLPADAGKLGAPLAEAGVDPKLVKRFGKDLRGAVGGLAKLAAASQGLEAWQARSYERVLGQSHKILGMLLGALPPEHRAAAATQTADAWAKLADRPEVAGRLPFALSSAAGLVDSAVRMEARRKLVFTPEQLAEVASSAEAEVAALLADNSGRDGLTTMLNVFPRLVEELELNSQGLDAPARAALVHDVRLFMQDVLPRVGTDLADASDLARAISVAARKNPQDAAATLTAAKELFLAPRAEALEAARAGVARAPDAAQSKAYAALRGILDANPAGPPELFAAVTQAKDQFAALTQRAGADQNKQAALDHIVSVLEQTKDSPAAMAALQFVTQQGANLVNRPDVAATLGEAAKRGDLGKGLLTAMQTIFPRAAGTPWDQALAFLDELSPAEATNVAFAHASVANAVQADGDLVWALAQRVQAGGEVTGADLASFAKRWQQAAPQVAANAQRGAVLAAIVGESRGEAIDVNRLRTTTQTMQQITPYLQGADPAQFVGPGPDGEPGLWDLADPQAGWATQPTWILQRLLQAANGAQGIEPKDLVHLAMKVSHSAAFIQNGQNIQVQRITADFGNAAKNPAGLKAAAGPKGQVALRAQVNAPSVLGFVKDHDALPVDFVLSAGLNLTSDQMTWAVDQVEKAHGLDFARLLRDCVLGCVEAGRLDIMEALRTSKSDSKAIRGVVKEVAQSYRVRAMGQLPVDALIAGLAAGEDPVALAAAEKAKAAFGDLDLVALAGGKIDSPEGLEEINGLADNIAELLQQFKTEFKSMDGDIDMGKLRPVLDEVLKSVLQGTWPAPKYEDEVGKRQLAMLSPAQQAIWRQSTVVTAAGPQPVEDAGPAMDEAMALARGLAKKIPEQVKLPKGVAFDEATVTRLRDELNEVVGKLRDVKKGSPEHRELSGRAGPLSLQLAVTEVQVALQGIGPDADPKATLDALEGLIPAGARALRKFGATGCASVLGDLGHTISDLRPAAATPGTGKWAADQDSLTAMIDSHKSGCLSKGDRRRRWGLAGSLADANTKMLRVFNGSDQNYRAFMRLMPMKIGNYEGPALYIESPVGDRGGSGDDLKLLNQVLLEKAKQLGIPALGGSGETPEGWKLVNNAQPTITFDPGHTGCYHSDRLGQQKNQAAVEPWQVNGRNMNMYVPPQLADQF